MRRSREERKLDDYKNEEHVGCQNKNPSHPNKC